MYMTIFGTVLTLTKEKYYTKISEIFTGEKLIPNLFAHLHLDIYVQCSLIDTNQPSHKNCSSHSSQQSHQK